jgi:selenocysteine lyase/cysteine desulfurase/CRP-like cAMP-binding protein
MPIPVLFFRISRDLWSLHDEDPMSSSARRNVDQLLARLSDPAQLAALGWERRALKGGELLWKAGEPACSLAWVEQGALRVLVDGDERGKVGVQELVGEASVFTVGARRSADLQATRPSVLWVLSRDRLLALRDHVPAVYDGLLAAAVATMSRRLVQNEHELTRRREGQAQAPAAAKRFARWPQGPHGRPAPPGFSLAVAQLPSFANVPASIVDEVGTRSAPLFIEPEEALCLEGDPADSMYLVAEGGLRVVLTSAKGGAIDVGGVTAGSLVGTSAMLQGTARTASLVANEPTWVYELPRAALDELSDPAWRALAETLVVILREQLVRAHVATIRSKGARGSIALEDAMPVLGQLQGWSADQEVLVSLSALAAPGPALELDPATRAKVELVRRSIVGSNVALRGPFGLKRVVYADYTASGRPLSFVEDYLRDQVMPLYANTHTEASASGRQTSEFREEARRIVHDSVGGSELDAVVFVGSGATGAINKLVGILNLRIPADLDARYGWSRAIPPRERPVVFVGPYEHHSNILPWKHTIADVVTIGLDDEGQVDLAELEAKLVEHADRPLKIGTFSAASNVTGIKADTVAVATLLHRHGALSFWDYASAAPYVRIDMNPSGPGIDAALAHKDAVFISPHKFVGGPGSPGVLVVKRALAQNRVPADPGGGTVDFVSSAQVLYTDAIEAREEGGTPEILGSIRCGLAFHVKEQVGAETIVALEDDYVRRAIAAWRNNPAISIVGNPDAARLSITSFIIRHGDRFLHYGLVVALLNDVFGVQARGGCSCAGPYGGLLLGLGREAVGRLFACASDGWSAVKPGWARVNFNYFIGEEEFHYIVSAVQLIAVHGWALAPRYDFDPRTGLWTHRKLRGHGHHVAKLRDLSISGNVARWGAPWPSTPEGLEDQLAAGRAQLEAALVEPPPETPPMQVVPEFEALRWFPLPHELAADLREHQRA